MPAPITATRIRSSLSRAWEFGLTILLMTAVGVVVLSGPEVCEAAQDWRTFTRAAGSDVEFDAPALASATHGIDVATR